MSTARYDLSVLVVDDSAVARHVLSALLGAAGMRVQAAHDPLFALQKLERAEPDVVVLDLEMPRMDGITFLRRLRRETDIPVVVCSGITDGRCAKAMVALEEGAVEVVSKPKTGMRQLLYESAVVLVDAVVAAAETRPAARARRKLATCLSPSQMPRRNRIKGPRVVAIGASTGGPDAVRRVLSGWSKDAPPITVVQHMPAGFTRAFADRLNETTPITVREAASGDTLRPGLALIAPGGRHLLVRETAGELWVEVIDGPLVSRHRPSVDMLFGSVAENVGADAIGVMLTGMGDDGAQGLLQMKQAGAVTFAQDEESSVVFGMPKAAIDIGAVDEITSLDALGDTLLRHC
jgi:two-component system chemotaxis response regulator CheB